MTVLKFLINGSTQRESESVSRRVAKVHQIETKSKVSRFPITPSQRFISWRPGRVSAAGMLFLKAAAITKLPLRRPDDGHVFLHSKEDLCWESHSELVPVRSGSFGRCVTWQCPSGGQHAALNNGQNAQLPQSLSFSELSSAFYMGSNAYSNASVTKIKQILLLFFVSFSWVRSIWLAWTWLKPEGEKVSWKQQDSCGGDWSDLIVALLQQQHFQ